MRDRSMVVVAGGSSRRFGTDKLMADVAGRPLISHTISTVREVVEHCVLVARADQIEALEAMGLGVEIVPGGSTRTDSEVAGIAAVGQSVLIGVHDGARPAATPEMMERLFAAAAESGGAVPGLPPLRPLIERDGLRPVSGAVRVQTPQVFWGPELIAAYRSAVTAGFTGHDTADVVRNFTNLEVVVVPGDLDNIKVTYPDDLDRIRDRLS